MTLSAAVEAAIVAHARQAAPHECCGLLVGTATAIVEAVPARNLADDPARRYLIDPHDHFRAVRAARAQALDVIGAYHSHPRSAPVPSPTDRADGFGQFLFLIVGLATAPPRVAAWIWRDGNFDEIPLVRTQ